MQEASEKDCRKLAEFAEEILRQSYQVVAVRTEQYYRRMLAEQKSEHGGIVMIEKNGKLVGSFLLQKGDPMKSGTASEERRGKRHFLRQYFD